MRSEEPENLGAKAVDDAWRAAVAVAWFARDSKPSGSIMMRQTKNVDRRLRLVQQGEK